MNKSPQKDLLLQHDYDGIQELDNDLPPWWLNMFYVTIVFSFLYIGYYHVFGKGLTSREEYQKEINPNWTKTEIHNSGFGYHSPYYSPSKDITPRILKELSGYIGEGVTFEELVSEAKRRGDEKQLELLNTVFPDGSLIVAAKPKNVVEEFTLPAMELLTDAASLDAGKIEWVKNCVSCHGLGGEGGIGPNITDEYWIHGGSINDIASIIVRGVPAKGMISWKTMLSTDKIHQVASYIVSLQGTNPPNAKAPQGDKYTAPAE